MRITRRRLLSDVAGAAAVMAAARHLSGSAVGMAPGTDAAATETPAACGAVWDGHVHLSGLAGTVEERVDQLIAFADRMGIERLVLFLGIGYTADPSPDELRKQNDDVLRALAHAPDRLLGMVYLNPKHTEASLAELDRCVAHGPMVGVKLWIAMRCSQPELDPIVRRAVALKVPILQHTYDRVEGNLPGESSSADVAALAARHPDASFICAHTSTDWERGIRMIRAASNVCAEISGSDPTAGFVEMAVRELGPDRVIFGSDAGGRSFASQLAKVTSADLSDADKRQILGGNLRRLLGPILAQKGLVQKNNLPN
jgi:predicted TIM-barrel fold metal-dependent hydrolase